MRYSPNQNAEYDQVLLFDQLAHDLKDPIVVIANTLEQCSWRLEQLPQENQSLSRVRAEVDWMVKFIDQMLELARLEAGRTQRHLQLVFVDDLLHETVDELTEFVSARDRIIDVLPSDDNECAVMTDEGLLHRLLVLLLTYATRKATSKVQTRVCSWSATKSLCIEIIFDSEPSTAAMDGPDLQSLKWIDHSDRQFGMTGLELLIASRIAQTQCGSIEIGSKGRRAFVRIDFAVKKQSSSLSLTS